MSNQIIDLPQSQYKVLGIKQPPPPCWMVVGLVVAIVGASLLFAVG